MRAARVSRACAAGRASRASRASRARPAVAALVVAANIILACGACTYPLSTEPVPSTTSDSPTAFPPDSPDVDFFAHEMLSRGAPAVVVQIKVRGREWSQAYGSQDVETGEPAAVDGRIQAGGITQSM